MINRKYLILAIILGLLTVLTVKMWINRELGSAKVEVPTFPVVVAAINIKPRTEITEEMITIKYVPQEFMVPDAIGDKNEVLGKICLTVLMPGEQVLRSKIKTKGSSLGLSFKIPPGFRAVSVRVAADTGIAGLIQPGDLVDVLVTISGLQGATAVQDTRTITVLQNVQVIAIDQATESFGGDAGGGQASTSPIVTFALSLQDAERITLANRKGSLSLVLRSFNDAQRVISSGADMSQVLYPNGVKATKARIIKPGEYDKVEIISGTKIDQKAFKK